MWGAGTDEIPVAAHAPALHVDDWTVPFRALAELLTRQQTHRVVHDGDAGGQQDLERTAQAFGDEQDRRTWKDGIAQIQLQFAKGDLELQTRRDRKSTAVAREAANPA